MPSLLDQYLPLAVFMAVAAVISGALLVAPFLVAFKAPDPEQRMSETGAMTVRHCRSVVAQQLQIYKGIISSEMVRRQILSAYEPRILGKGPGHEQDPLRNPRRNP
jgi:NADH:ubiquinone oxidoreductase subunit 3 (subunit A)